MTYRDRNKAIVVGASLGGLLAARVAADFYQTVTVVERDRLPADPVNRRGVPQGKHPHALLGKSVEIIGGLFPGIFDQLVADGAVRWDDGDLSRFWSMFAGHLMVRTAIPDPASLTDYHMSRPLLEHAVRRAVRDIPNVEILEEHDFVGVTADPNRARITGARVHKHGTTDELALTADLVVDATGRGSRAPVFLEELGYRRPRVDEVEVQIAYSTLPVRIPRGALRELVVANYPIPSRSTMFATFACEQDIYLVLGGTIGGQEPPASRTELFDLVAKLAPRDVAAVLRSAEPLADIAQYRIPSNRWRRYDKLSRIPEGLLVFGDAICSFNPIYGQGITVAALEAEALRDCLRNGNRNVARRFYRESAKKIQVAWRTAVSSDLALPQVPGRRPLSVRAMNSYMDRVLIATETDPVVAQQFFRVVWMLDGPSALFRPYIVGRIAKANRVRAQNHAQLEA
ncbi:NAD(P)/FAD-dependent oxidoreductase [Mycobacterium sp. 1245852.3]|uniref:FAD-dependent oxidoreductase n=1 Tax=Mycobacterium sp. 1245852.3 TaxID=1856860 RepID=UPI00080246A5|nr:FAD-dependent oxidoreductase [Mycobacterium sp. 1245852.3]OBJ85808.1 2-polyprenyl-6-methoxyphenol hydroxylase-like oxidoreductase [Mycobacterium sp. 1245852.3]